MFRETLFLAIRNLSTNSSLRTSTWRRLKNEKPSIYLIKKRRDSFHRKKTVNNPRSAILVTILCHIILILFCFLPEKTVDEYLFFLKWVSFKETSIAYEIITTTLGTAATIIGLSFVVIGFLFEAVRNKTQRTLEDLFRTTWLYYVFSISVVSILALIFANTFKSTFSDYVAGNLAIAASIILATTTISIGCLFYKVLLFLNPEKIAQLTKSNLIDLASYASLKDIYIQATGQCYEERMIKEGFTKGSDFSLNPTPVKRISILQGDNKLLVDIWMPLLVFTAKRIMKRSKSGSFISICCDKEMSDGQTILTYADGTKISKLEQKMIALSFHFKVSENNMDDYEIEKNKLLARILRASEISDAQMLQEALEELDILYKIYYDSQ